jgi:hypothetical protein
MVRLDSSGLGHVSMAGYIKRGEFLDQLTDYWFLKKNSAPWS